MKIARKHMAQTCAERIAKVASALEEEIDASTIEPELEPEPH